MIDVLLFMFGGIVMAGALVFALSVVSLHRRKKRDDFNARIQKLQSEMRVLFDR